MMASGNGAPQQCADNLLKTPRFSVPYERIKGIDGGLVDTPAASAGAGMAAALPGVIAAILFNKK